MKNVRKLRDIKSIITDKRRNRLASEPNYHTTKYFSENLLAIQMKKTKVKMNKPVYLGMSILNISETLLFILKLKIFAKTLLMLKNGSTNQTIVKMNAILLIKDHFQ